MRPLAEVIGAYAGLSPPSWLLEARVRERAEELGLDEGAYLELVRGSSDRAERERQHLTERLRVGETKFFRHRAQVEALKEHVLPLLSVKRGTVRVWSAGCASGEEAFTLAMLLDLLAPRQDWEVIGTDVSAAAVADAKSARFSRSQLQEIPEPLRTRYFQVEKEHAIVRHELRDRVRFEQQNLLGRRHPRGVDLLLCRNVLIYFEAQRKKQVIAHLTSALRPGGWLCLGYSESLNHQEQTHLEPVRVKEAVLYRRRESTPKRAAPPRSRTDPASAPTAPPPHADAPRLPLRLKLRGEYHDGARLSAELRPFLSQPSVVDLDGAAFLGDEAARVLQRALGAAPDLRLTATRPPILRWLEKHRLVRR
jgi:chemotaxis protein methyltransferase CheR